MALRLRFGMVSGVGMWPMKKPFQIYLVLLAQMMPLLRLTWSFLVVSISGMRALLERLMIERWMSMPLSLEFCIQLVRD